MHVPLLQGDHMHVPLLQGDHMHVPLLQGDHMHVPLLQGDYVHVCQCCRAASCPVNTSQGGINATHVA